MLTDCQPIVADAQPVSLSNPSRHSGPRWLRSLVSPVAFVFPFQELLFHCFLFTRAFRTVPCLSKLSQVSPRLARISRVRCVPLVANGNCAAHAVND